jgi:hypothetical protein
MMTITFITIELTSRSRPSYLIYLKIISVIYRYCFSPSNSIVISNNMNLKTKKMIATIFSVIIAADVESVSRKF